MSQMSKATARSGSDTAASMSVRESAVHPVDSPDPAREPDLDTSANADVEPHSEIELKFSCDPARLSEVANVPIISEHARGAGTNVDLKAIYYDTPDFDLRKSDLALRVRSDGSRCVMTLKSGAPKNGKALMRDEWSVSVPAMEPDLAALSQVLSSEILARIQAAPLHPVFSTEVRRHTRVLDTPLGTVELALDRGRIVAGERFEQISEVELELLQGRTEAIYQLTHDLLKDTDLRPSIRSKSARGFDLALDTAPEAGKARKIRIGGDPTLDQALDRILRAAFQHLMESQPAAEDGRRPEGLHQFRVALRRLRSVLTLVRSIAPQCPRLNSHRDDARWLMAELGDARNWDVLATETVPEIAQACPSVEGFDSLAGLADRYRHEAHERARAAIANPRTGRFQIALALWVEQKGWRVGVLPKHRHLLSAPARGFAIKALRKFHRTALKRGSHFRKLTPDERHRLRIAVKKLRYAADFLAPLAMKKAACRQYSRILAELQDQLGHANDMVVTQQLVREILKSEVPPAARGAAGALAGWQTCNLKRNDEQLLSTWKRFRKLPLP